MQADVRVIAATNQNLETLVASGAFREDLFYRLDVLQLTVPPLRERPGDIPELADHFLNLASLDAKIPPKPLSIDAQIELSAYAWPGNIRELRNTISRALILSDDRSIQVEDLSLPQKSLKQKRINFDLNLESLEQARRQASEDAKRGVESVFIDRLMAAHKHNISQAARALGMKRASLHKMIKRVNDQE